MNDTAQYYVTANDKIVTTHASVLPAIESYDHAGAFPDKTLGFAKGKRAGLLMARDATGHDVTMRHELSGRDLADPEVSIAVELIERQILSKHPEQDLSNPMIGDGVPFERIRRITGYLVGSLDRFNNAKRSEVADRITNDLTESLKPMDERLDIATNESQQLVTGRSHDNPEREKNRG